MIYEYCEDCRWWDSTHPRIKYAPKVDGIETPGICRKHKPAAYHLDGFMIGVQPLMDAKDSCAEVRGKKKE